VPDYSKQVPVFVSHVVPLGQQTCDGPVTVMPQVDDWGGALHGVEPAGQLATSPQVAGTRCWSKLHAQTAPVGFPAGQQVYPRSQVPLSRTGHRHSPLMHTSLIRQRFPQLPQWRASVFRTTQTPPHTVCPSEHLTPDGGGGMLGPGPAGGAVEVLPFFFLFFLPFFRLAPVSPAATITSDPPRLSPTSNLASARRDRRTAKARIRSSKSEPSMVFLPHPDTLA
jgi:hypothetical protein